MNPHRPQVLKLAFDILLHMRTCGARQDPVEPRETSEITAESRTVICAPLLYRPPPKSAIDAIHSKYLACAPAQKVPQKDVNRHSRVLDSERSLDPAPRVLMEFLLQVVRQTHEQPVLDLLALRQRTTGGVQALEDLLWIILVAESDADDPQPLKPGEHPLEVAADN